MTSLRASSFYSVSGLLLGVGFVYPPVWFLSLFGITLQLYLIINVKPWRYLGSFLAWGIKFLLVLSFYWSIYPIQWLPFSFSPAVEVLLVGLYWITVSVFLATGGLVLAGAIRGLKGVLQHTPWLGFMVVPMIWVGSEVAGSYLLSLFTLGSGSTINGYFSFGYIGLLLSEHNGFFLLSKFAGVYGLSFVAVLIAWGILWVAKKYRRAVKVVIGVGAVFGLLLTNSLVLPMSEPTENQVRVATINTWFPVAESFSREALPAMQAEQTEAMEAALAIEPDYILTGEDERLLNQADGIETVKNFWQFRYASSAKPTIIDSSRIVTAAGAVLQGLVYDTSTNEHTIAHKKYLVPQGEFVPYLYDWGFRLFGLSGMMDELNRLLSYRVGEKTSQADFAPTAPGILFCFESSAATGVRSLVLERPNLPFVVHPVSHAWFNDSNLLRQQIEASLRIQASWNNLTIISAGRHAPSQIFMPSGEVTEPTIVASDEFWNVAEATIPIRNAI
jgi:hypothetical protein